MDVLRLDEDFVPDLLIEGYESMIWTERYREPGEFKLTTKFIADVKSALPVDTLISLRDTKEVMIVENHAIVINEEDEIELVVTGRSWDSFMEQRTIVGDLEGFPKKGSWLTQKPYTPGTAAALLIWNHMVDNDPVVTGANDNTHGVTYTGDSQDVFPNLRVTRTHVGESTGAVAKKRLIEPGYLNEKVLDFLARGNAGVRTIRPHGQSADILSFEADGDGVEETNPGIQSKLILDVYKGLNRAYNQSENPKVTFNTEKNHFLREEYLWSKKTYKNIAYVDNKFGTIQVLAPWVTGAGDELNRRVLFIQAEDKEDGVSEADYLDTIADKAEAELEKQRRRIWFQGEVIPNGPHKYKQDYDLGDKVTLKGDYGVKEIMRVIEYIRTQDFEGDRGHPTLASVEED